GVKKTGTFFKNFNSAKSGYFFVKKLTFSGSKGIYRQREDAWPQATPLAAKLPPGRRSRPRGRRSRPRQPRRA
ncbi:hypothetical protein NQ317_002893, partial [Molorchus minor]